MSKPRRKPKHSPKDQLLWLVVGAGAAMLASTLVEQSKDATPPTAKQIARSGAGPGQLDLRQLALLGPMLERVGGLARGA